MNNSLISTFYSQENYQKWQDWAYFLNLDSKSVNIFLILRILGTTLVFAIILLFTNFKIYFNVGLTIMFYYLFTYFIFTKPFLKKQRKLLKESLVFLEVLFANVKSNEILKEAIFTTAKNLDSDFAKIMVKSWQKMASSENETFACQYFKQNILNSKLETVFLNLIMARNLKGQEARDFLLIQQEFLKN